MRKGFDKRNDREREPIPLDAVEGYLDLVGWDTDAITFSNLWGQPGRDHELKYLKDKVRSLRDSGEAELRPPWPIYDLMSGNPAYVETGRGRACVWEWYSPEALLERVLTILEGALDGTTNYAHGLSIFCVSAALQRAGEVILGVVHDPIGEETFVAERGRGVP